MTPAGRLLQRTGFVLATVLMLARCTEPTAPLQVGEVQITATATSIQVGQTLQLTATVIATNDAVLTGRPVAWSSPIPAVATVNLTGLVTAVAPGVVNITATAGGVTGSYSVTVVPIPVATVQVTPATPTVYIGLTQQMAVITRSGTGAVLTGRTVTWSSANEAVATVSNTGLVTGVASGTVQITATSEGISGNTLATVAPVPVASVSVTPAIDTIYPTQTLQLTAQPRSADGTPLAGRDVIWNSVSTGVATVSTTGLLTAVGVGSSLISAESEGRVGTMTIFVRLVPVASVTVSPSVDTLYISQSTALTAVPRDSANGALAGRFVGWGTSNGSVASVNVDGLVTATGLGTATITATSEGMNGTATIVVVPLPVDSVSLSPTAATRHPTQTVQFIASTFDSTNTILAGRSIAWSLSDSSVATVNGSGLVTASAVGVTQVTATSEGVSASATLTVTPVPVVSVVVTATDTIIEIGGTTQLSASPRDSAGGVLTGRSVAWFSPDTTIAKVSPAGLVTGIGVGFLQIQATVDGINGTLTVDVNPVPVATVTVSPTRDTVMIGTGVQLSVEARDAGGTLITGRVVNWGSLTGAFANVNASGFVTGNGIGTEKITAYVVTTSARGVNTSDTASALITVIPVPVASVTVSPGVVQTVRGHAVQLTAATFDSIGGTLSGRSIAWTSSDTAVAVVSASGVVTGRATGSVSITASAEGVNGTSTIQNSSLTMTAVEASVSHACALTNGGEIWCWGSNEHDALGNAVATDTTLPTKVSGGLTFAALSVSGHAGNNPNSGSHSCALTTTGAAYCWGENNDAELGIGSIGSTTYDSPQAVLGGLTFSSISTGQTKTCGIATTGETYCWGSTGGYWGVGDGTVADRYSPTLVTGGHSFAQISVGGSHTCAVTTTGEGYCWGYDGKHQLGLGSPPPGSYGCINGWDLNHACPSPVLVSGGHTWSKISASDGFTCGLTTAGAAYCWGQNSFGQLGIGVADTSSYAAPQLVSGGHTFASIRASHEFACGLTAAGALYCWGQNGFGQFGNGTTTNSESPVAAATGLTLASISSGGYNAITSCGRTTGGVVYCWGHSLVGQGGSGTREAVQVPRRVSGQP